MADSTSRGGPASLGDNRADEIYRRIYQAVLSHQLLPGTKLPEEKLAALFGVNRTVVRKVLARLEHEQVVEIFHNRGAFVAEPSVDQAADTLEARRVIEAAIVRSLAERATPADIAKLHQHLAAEEDSDARGDRTASVRLSGEFHNVVAELAGNRALARMLRELAALTSLTILLYDVTGDQVCMISDHALITDAIERRDPAAAAETMVRHLKDVENTLVFDSPDVEVDLAAIFGA